MAQEAMDVCLRAVTEGNKTRFDSYCHEHCVDHFPYNLSFRIVVCTFFLTTLLKMAVTYSLWCSKTLFVFIFRLFKAA